MGCVSGAIQKSEYLQLIEENGFTNITVQKEREIALPDDVLKNYLSADEIADYRQQDKGIYSITVFAQKPSIDSATHPALVEVAGATVGASCCGSDCCN